MSTLEERVQRLEDERAIIDRLYAYCTSLDYGHRDEWLDWTEDGVLAWPHETFTGRDEIARAFDGHSHAPEAFHKHVIVDPRVSLNGDEATAESYFSRLNDSPDGPVVRSFGRYMDALVRCDDGAWRIRERRLERESLIPRSTGYMSRDLAGRKILVSGGSSGLGGAIAVACAQDGAAVAAIGRDKGKLDDLAAATGVTPIVADVGDPVAARAAVESAATALGGLDGIVINAGLMLHSLIGDGLDEDWDAIVRVNILGMLHITSAAIPHLRAAPLADLCVIASLASDRVAAPDYSVYAATKAAQLRLTEGLRLELAEDRGIRVSLVKPGFMNTAGIGTGTRDPERQKMVLELKERIGLPPATVAEEIRHLMALPAEITIPELMIVPTARP